jgi:hypothetical protein
MIGLACSGSQLFRDQTCLGSLITPARARAIGREGTPRLPFGRPPSRRPACDLCPHSPCAVVFVSRFAWWLAGETFALDAVCRVAFPGIRCDQHHCLVFGQRVISVLGALTITSEYSTGMIHASLAVQPRRSVLLAAKGLFLALVTLVTGLVTTFAAFFIGQAILSSKHVSTTLGQPNVLRAVIGGALFLTRAGRRRVRPRQVCLP